MEIALWGLQKFTTRTYPVGGASVAAAPTPLPVEITQYRQNDVFDRVVLEISGNVVVAGGGVAGTATGAPNPHGILNKLTLQTQPTYNGVIPFNNVSARSLLTDAALAKGYFIDPVTPIPDVAGTYAVRFFYELYFKRPSVRKGIQWALYLQKYTSVLLTTNFGGREQLFTGGTNTWDLSGLSINYWADSDLAVSTDLIHASEIFEQTYPITAAQTDFPIDTLPPGFLYTDLTFQTEVDGALANTVLNNIDIEGGGRVWLRQGDANAPFVQRMVTQLQFNDQNQVPESATTPLQGIYGIPLRDGMISRAIDALQAPITIKLDVSAPGSARLVRLLVRRSVPGGVLRAKQSAGKTTTPNVAGH